MTAALPFRDSRRLTGANLYFAAPGAVLDTVGIEVDGALLEGWRARAAHACARLGWPGTRIVARAHPAGASLALAAPWDQLYVATEVNEWALCASVVARDPACGPGLAEAWLVQSLDDADDPSQVVPPVLDEPAALARLGVLAARAERTALRALLAAAERHDVPVVFDDESLTLGLGAHGRDYPLSAPPRVDEAPWDELRAVPAALVTGSNGKTTIVRLIAACTRAHGWRTGYTCTDGAWLDDDRLAEGDYSGPAGARRVARDRRADAIILETARGGLLRRGIAVPVACAAVVANVSSDHFGEYGIHDLDALADVKLTVAAVLAPEGLLVLNADDPLLCAKAAALHARFGRDFRIGWFAADADLPRLQAHRIRGGATCGVRDGRLWLERSETRTDLGAVAAMPLTAGGAARYNVANLAAAALAAERLGVPPRTIAAVFASFGARPGDNAGRLMRYGFRGVQVLVDYAHNPAALRGVLQVARDLAGKRGRVGMLLGHAGNRRDADIAAVARVAAEFRPDLVVVKENVAQLRGRAPGEITRILREALLAAGLPEATVPVRASELDAVQCALAWARPGDVLALLVHSSVARAAVVEQLERG